MWKRIAAVSSVLFFTFANSALAITIDDDVYFENEDVSVTSLTGDNRNIWLYPSDTTENCTYPSGGLLPCSPGTDLDTGELPHIIQQDASDRFGIDVILYNNDYTLIETMNTQDCSTLDEDECKESVGYLDDVDFSMTSTTIVDVAFVTDNATDICVTNVSGATTTEWCYNPLKVQAFYLIDFAFFAFCIMVAIYLLRKIFNL
jgi:hypothetical protein